MELAALILATVNIIMILLVNKELDEYEKRMDKTFEEMHQILNELERKRNKKI